MKKMITGHLVDVLSILCGSDPNYIPVISPIVERNILDSNNMRMTCVWEKLDDQTLWLGEWIHDPIEYTVEVLMFTQIEFTEDYQIVFVNGEPTIEEDTIN